MYNHQVNATLISSHTLVDESHVINKIIIVTENKFPDFDCLLYIFL